MQDFYMKFAVLKPKRKKKFKDERTVCDFDITEDLLMTRWESIFGPGSLILCKIIYIRASRR